MNTKTPLPAMRDVRGELPESVKKREGDQAPEFTLGNIDADEVALSVNLEDEIELVIFGHRVVVLVLQRSPS